MPKPAVSIIVPNFNHADYLDRRLDSILNQTYQDFEIIILDDCSTDSSQQILEKYRNHSKVSQIIYNLSNSGSTFKQWKKGIEIAKGNWIWIAESDDVATERFLEIMMGMVTQFDNINVAFSNSVIIDENDIKIGDVTWMDGVGSRDWSKNFFNDGLDEIKNYFFCKNIIPNASAAIFRRSAVDPDIFSQLNHFKFAGDWLFWIHLLKTGNVGYTALTLNHFRNHANTTRSPKNAGLESRRLEEALSILRLVKEKYNLHWDVKKHLWLLHSWAKAKYRFSEIRVFVSGMPLQYGLVILLKWIREIFKR